VPWVILGTLLGMTACENCGTLVDSRWKFCLHCGARMATVVDDPIIGPPPEIAVAVSDTRGEHVGRRRRRFDWQLGLGILFALAGIGMIVYLVIVLVVPHA
jgi:hypothetical protein